VLCDKIKRYKQYSQKNKKKYDCHRTTSFVLYCLCASNQSYPDSKREDARHNSRISWMLLLVRFHLYPSMLACNSPQQALLVRSTGDRRDLAGMWYIVGGGRGQSVPLAAGHRSRVHDCYRGRASERRSAP
jgi:hypothetical protein